MKFSIKKLTGETILEGENDCCFNCWARKIFNGKKKYDLSGSNLSGSNLSGSDLSGSDLSRSNLSGSNLSGSDLSGSNLPSPTILLLSNWGEVSPELCADLMEFDAACHPDRSKFDEWAAGGLCPYNGTKIQRAANFTEKKALWGKGTLCSSYNLMVRLLNEKTKGWKP